MELDAQTAQAQAQAQQNILPTLPTPAKEAKRPKLPSFVDGRDDIDSYLLRFERYATNVKWASDTWAIKLSALLSGKAMDVYTRLSTEDAQDYSKLKKSLLTRYNYTDEGYRQRLRNDNPEEEETPRQFGVRIRDYMTKWIDLSGVESSDVHAIEDLFQREQFVESCPRDLAVHLKRQNPKTLEEMTDAAERYLDATGETMASQLAEQQRRLKKSRGDVPRPNLGKDVRDSRDHIDGGPTCYTCQGHSHLS